MIPSLLVLLLLATGALLFQVEVAKMTRDMAAIAKIHPLTGVLSNLGVLLWCATAAICWHTARLLRDATLSDDFRFFRSSAILTTYLLTDDFFQLHDFLVPQYLGWNEGVVYVLLACGVATYFIRFRRIIRRSNFGTLAISMLFLTSSLAMDTILQPWLHQLKDDWAYFIEDSAKWLGIACWCSYFSNTAYQTISGRITMAGHTIPTAMSEPGIKNPELPPPPTRQAPASSAVIRLRASTPPHTEQ